MSSVPCRGTVDCAEQSCTWLANVVLISAAVCRGSWSSNAWGTAATTGSAPPVDKKCMPVVPGADMHCMGQPQPSLAVCACCPYLRVRWPSFCRDVQTSSAWDAGAATWTPPSGARPGAVPKMRPCMPSMRSMGAAGAASRARCRGGRRSSAGPGGWVGREGDWAGSSLTRDSSQQAWL